MTTLSRRIFTLGAAIALLAPGAALAADKPTQIAIDWATYNPVSILLKKQGLL